MATAPCKPFGVTTLFRLARLLLVGPWLVNAIIFGATSLSAQELVRSSAGELPIQSFKKPEATFNVGPFQETLSGSADVEYTDNINLTDTDKISDLSFHQHLNLNTTWVISQLNQLEFNFGGQLIENFYGNGKSEANFAVSPDSMIQLQFAVSNFRIRLYDQFSYVQNPTTDPTATNTANLNSLTNTIGTVVDADLDLAILSFSADYTYNDQSGATASGQTNPTTTGTRNSFRVGSALTFNWSPTVFYGINSSATRSTGAHAANVNSLSIGPFLRGSLGQDLDFDLGGGINSVDTKPSVPLGYYVSAVMRYQIDRNWQAILSASHDLEFSAGTSLTELTEFRIATQLNLTRFITLSGSAFVDLGDVESSTQAAANFGVVQGSFTQYGAGLSLAWQLRKHWSSTLTYDLTRREADSASTSYLQNTVAFSLGYAF